MGDFDVFLVHTYTRKAVKQHAAANMNDPIEDDWGDALTDQAVGVSGVPCWFRPRSRVRINDQGIAEVDPVALYVLSDDPLKEGDVVSNILSEAGDVIFGGSLTVQMVSPRTLDQGIEVVQADLLGAQVTV
jgi:hypothetical protein